MMRMDGLQKGCNYAIFGGNDAENTAAAGTDDSDLRGVEKLEQEILGGEEDRGVVQFCEDGGRRGDIECKIAGRTGWDNGGVSPWAVGGD